MFSFLHAGYEGSGYCRKKKTYPANAGYMYIFSANINTNAIIPLTQKCSVLLTFKFKQEKYAL